MCGEHLKRWRSLFSSAGSSPHARGTPAEWLVVLHVVGIIPACAGSTPRHGSSPACRRDHPRMCGEHTKELAIGECTVGSSPHVRGARHSSHGYARFNRDHPRMCGEHQCMFPGQVPRRGSSPHVRGAHLDRRLPRRESGIIPACAGSTWPASPPWHSSWDHPRMCGEHFIFGGDLPLTEGSSPHVRGAP